MNNTNKTEREQIAISLQSLLLNYNQCFNHFLDIRQYRLTKTQLMIILALSIHPGLTMGELSEKISTSREQASRAVTPLVNRQLISRNINQLNRRQINVALTAEGKKCLTHIKEVYHELLVSSFDKLSDEELHTFFVSLKNVSQTLTKLMK